MIFDAAALIPLGQAVARIGLPFLPSILANVVPFPLSLLTAPAVTAILAALGVDPTAHDAPVQAAARIDADPVAAKTALQPVEDYHAAMAKIAEDEFEAGLRDVENARATEVQYVQAKSTIQWGAPVVSVVAVAGFVGVAVLVMTGHGGDTAAGQLILGAMIGAWTTVIQFWLGSSKGSADKTATLADLAKQPQIVQGPGSHVSGGVAPLKRR